MPLASLLVPPGLLAAAAGLSLGLGLLGIPVGRWICAVAAWLALLAVAAGWLSGTRAPVEVSGPVVLAGSALTLRLDAVTVLFELAVLLPLALLLAFQPRTWARATTAALAGAATVSTLEAGSLLLTAFGLATCAGLGLMAMRQEERAGPTSLYWVTQTIAWLLLLWAAVVLQVTGGTSAYGAVPVTAVRVQVFALLAGAAVLCSGLLPCRTWVSEAWSADRPVAGPMVVALLVPLGFFLLMRAYGLGAGQWPAGWLNLAMTGLGAAVALGAAMRAQAASSRRGLIAESVPLAAGFALLALSLGTPLGVVAAVVAVAGLSVVAALSPALPAGRGAVALVGIAVAAGAPPGVVFAGWLLALQAALEASAQTGFLALAGGVAWLLALAAAARAVALPADATGATLEGSPTGSALTIALALVAGVGLGVLVTVLAVPAAGDLVAAPGRPAQTGILSGGALAVSTPSGGWSALLLAGPLLLLALAAAAGLRRAGAPVQPHDAVRRLPPPPLFEPPLSGVPERAASRVAAFRLPEQYRSLFRPAVIESAAARSRPWFWAVVTIALAIAVTR